MMVMVMVRVVGTDKAVSATRDDWTRSHFIIPIPHLIVEISLHAFLHSNNLRSE